MRHLVLLSASILGGVSAAGAVPLAAVATPSPKTASTGEECQRPNVIWAERDKSAKASKLGELPPGDLVLAVLRGTKGCYIPVVVRKGYGAPEFNQSPQSRSPEPSTILPRRN